MAELGRLLTFMYEEDRLTALSMYERMFDETADEQGLLQLLVSPTRQAVLLARSYDAKERKLQMQSQSEEAEYAAEAEDVPSFVFVIDKVAKQAEELGSKFLAVSEDQFSIFDEVLADAPEAETEVPAAEAEPVVKVSAPVEEEAEALPEESSNVEETAAAVDAFLNDFSVENGELVSLRSEEAEISEEAEEEIEETPAEAEAPVESRLKVNIFLLILYIFLALPIGTVGIALLLIPTALCLSLAAGCAGLGVSVVGSCFGTFAVIADTLVVFGAGLVCLALALFFAWLFICFLVGVIPGFIRGICRLGRKICCKEVAVQ